MLAHNLKDMFKVLPDLKEHVKEASFEEDYPLDNKDGALASYLRCQYLVKIAHKPVDPSILEQTKKAVNLYGMDKLAAEFDKKIDRYLVLEKQASIDKANKPSFEARVCDFEGNLTGFVDLEKVASEAEALIEENPDVKSEDVQRYSGRAYFNKEAAVTGLRARSYATGKDVFNKVADIVDRSMDDNPTTQSIRDVCRAVTHLDKQAGLAAKGFNFYKEALIVKVAGISSVLKINLAGKQIPYEKVARFGSGRIGSVLGDDIGSALTGNPMEDKQILETLPLDSQRVLANLFKTY